MNGTPRRTLWTDLDRVLCALLYSKPATYALAFLGGVAYARAVWGW